MSTSQEAKLQFRYELTGNGIQAVNRLTGEVLKLAAAEETAIGRAKQLGQEMQRSGGSGPSAGGFGRGPFTGGGGYVDRSIMSAPRPGFRDDNRRGGESELVRAISRLVDELHRLPEALRGMVLAGPQMGMGFGTGGVYIPPEFKHKPGSIGAIESGQERQEFIAALQKKREGEAARKQEIMQAVPGRVAGAAALAMAGAHMAGRYQSAYSTPFTHERDRARMFLGDGMMDIHDIAFVGTDEGSKIKQSLAMAPIRFGVESQYRREMHNLQQYNSERTDRRNFYDQGIGHLSPIGPTTRESLAQKQRYSLSQQLLPAKDRLSQAELEYQVAGRKVGHLDEQDRKYTDRIIELQDAIRKSDTPTYQNARQWPVVASNILHYQKEIQDLTDLQRANIGKRAEARDAFAEADRARKEARAGADEVRLGDLQSRESTARGQARQLGYLGVSGNMMADQAFQMIQMAGIENVPSEIVAQARSKYGQTLDDMAERSGQKYVPGAKQNAPEEYRDTVPDITAQVDKQMGEIRKDKTEAVGTALDGLAKSIAEQISQMQLDLIRRILDAQATFKREMYLKNAGG